MVRRRSMRERPSLSMAQVMTMSNFLRPSSLSMASRPGRWSRPLAPLAGIPVDLDHLPATTLGNQAELVDLVLDRLGVRPHPHIEGCALVLGQDWIFSPNH